MRPRPLALPLLLLMLVPAPGFLSAQDAPEDDLEIDPAEPDFTVLTLPTNLRLPQHRLAFRLTHRFDRPLGEGDFGGLLADLFGLDSGAQIGFGLRFAPLRGNQVMVYRTSDRTIELAAQQELLAHARHPLGVSAIVSVEGLDNFSTEFSPAVSLVLSRKLGTRGALYAVPSWVGNTRIIQGGSGDEDSTLVLGLAARLRLTGRMSLLGELSPRLAGYEGDRGSGDPASLASFGVEWGVGGHVFQLNFSNDLGTTRAQLARGQQGVEDWFIGFNLTRKFY